MGKKWTKPVMGITALGLAGAFVVGLDGIAQVLHPLKDLDQHDTFQLIATSTASDTGGFTMQNAITGDLIEAPWPEPFTVYRSSR